VFTGLIDDVGRITNVTSTDAGREFRVECRYADLTPGESIAVNGACLTVREQGPQWFTAAAVTTTLDRTTMGTWSAGARVNLERALRVGDRLGGHFVQGHVDGVATVEAVEQRGDARLIDLALPSGLAELMVPHGSVAVDGVSLTVAEAHDDGFTVALIPTTLAHTVAGAYAAGRQVNVEVDVVARYLERLQGTPGRTE
jgi:riboflavin synthase